MEYAIQLFLPILGGLLLGNWLHQRFGISQIWTMVLAVLGMAGGIAVLYKRQMYTSEGQPKFPLPFSPKAKDKTAESQPTHLSHQELLDLYQQVQEREEESDEKDDFALDGLLGDDDEVDEDSSPPKKPQPKPHDPT